MAATFSGSSKKFSIDCQRERKTASLSLELHRAPNWQDSPGNPFSAEACRETIKPIQE